MVLVLGFLLKIVQKLIEIEFLLGGKFEVWAGQVRLRNGDVKIIFSFLK